MSENVLEISNVLNYLIKQSNTNEAELARNINVPRATIYRLTSGRTPDPRASTLSIIAEYFNVSVDQLLGKQPIFFNNEQTIVRPNHTSIPVVPWEHIKNWKFFTEKTNPDNFVRWVIADPSIENGRFATELKGESMWPQFQENSVLIIDPLKKPKNRDFVIAYDKKIDEVVFRQLIIEGKYSFLKAINPIFPSITFDMNSEIIGTLIQTRNSYS